MGNYELTITVEALEEGLAFQETVQVYVAEPREKEENWMLNASRNVKSAFGYILGDPATAFWLMVVVFLIILGAGFRHLKEEKIFD